MKIIFVCKDNLTRSVAAEYAIRKYISNNNIQNVFVSSAGIDLGHFDKVFTAHFDELKKIGANDINNHIQRSLIEKMIDRDTLVIAMGKDHKEYVQDHFNCHCELFTKLAYGVEETIKIDWLKSEEEIDEQLRDMVHEFYKVAPTVLENAVKVMKSA